METLLARLDMQDRVLEQILAALAPPPETEASGLDELVEALKDLTAAVEAQGTDLRALRSLVSRRYLHGVEAA